MSDVNWTKYNCDICRAVGLVAAGAVAAAAAWVLSQIGLPVWLFAVLFLVIWAVLFYVVDNHCEGRGRRLAFEAGTSAHAAPSADDATSHDDQSSGEGKSEASAADSQLWAEQERAKAEAEAKEAVEQAERERQQAEAAAEEARQREEAEQRAAEQAEREAAERRAEDDARQRREAEEAAEAEARAEAERAAQARAEEQARASEMAEAPATFTGTPEPVGDPSLGPDRDGDGVREGTEEGSRPTGLDGPRGGVADDLKRIKGVGPKLEQLCHSLGFYHFDQIANWTADEVAWVDSNLGGFNGRVSRDDWIAQARVLAGGGETEFSKRVDDGDVPSSQ